MCSIAMIQNPRELSQKKALQKKAKLSIFGVGTACEHRVEARPHYLLRLIKQVGCTCVLRFLLRPKD